MYGQPISNKTTITFVLSILLCTSLAVTTIPRHYANALDSTILTLDPVANVVQGQEITVSGSLINNVTGGGVEGVTITFNGTGADNLSSTLTAANGTFSIAGLSPNTAGLWMLQAHFAGDEIYESASSNLETYNTTGFLVQTGIGTHLELVGFGASVDFDNVVADGEISVSECNTIASPRYLPLNVCLGFVSTLELATDSFAHVNISFDPALIPEGYAADDVSIFHEDAGMIIDVTEQRDNANNILMGRTNSFGNFILGIALHNEKPANSIRLPVFVGGGNTVSIRDINNPNGNDITITFSNSTFAINKPVQVSIIDPEANLDPDMKNTIVVIFTSTNDTSGLTVDLEETDSNTGEFTGNITIAANPSDPGLFAVVNDTITAYYEVTNVRLRATIDGIGEAGVIQLSDFFVNAEEVGATFIRLGNGIDLQLIDAQLDSNAVVTITMSYANLDIQEAPSEGALRIYKRITVETGEGFWIELPSTVNPSNRTVTAQTDSLGQFAIGCCPDQGPGGISGGPSVPGAGVVLDSSARVSPRSEDNSTPPNNDDEGSNDQDDNNTDRRRSSGGGGSRATTTIHQLPQGNDIETTTRVGSESIRVKFELVGSSGGQLEAVSKDIVDLEQIFNEIVMDEQNKEQGIVAIRDTTYSTAGTVFDINASGIQFSGMVDVTIPYKESMLDGDESNVKFLHYGQAGWEDATIAVDTVANTVTGRLSSLSPVVAGEIVVIDTRALNPLDRIAVIDAIVSSAKEIGNGRQAPSVSATIENTQSSHQDFTLIVQVIDKDGITHSISWEEGTLQRGEIRDISAGLDNSKQAGSYTVQMFIWNSLDKTPIALSEMTVKTLVID